MSDYTYTQEQGQEIIDRYNARVKPEFHVTEPWTLMMGDDFDEVLFANGQVDVEISAFYSISGHTELVTYYRDDFRSGDEYPDLTGYESPKEHNLVDKMGRPLP